MTNNANAIGMVLYTDGGCRPNPGFGGWGVHGYEFEMSKSTKGIGHPTHVSTAAGYENRTVGKDRRESLNLTPEARSGMTVEDIDAFESYKKQLKKANR